jgi:hypothetical protein
MYIRYLQKSGRPLSASIEGISEILRVRGFPLSVNQMLLD